MAPGLPGIKEMKADYAGQAGLRGSRFAARPSKQHTPDTDLTPRSAKSDHQGKSDDLFDYHQDVEPPDDVGQRESPRRSPDYHAD